MRWLLRVTPLLLVLLLVAPAAAAPGGPPDAWEAAIDRAVPAVVSLRVSAPRSFDMAPATNSVATGFVVDAERGIILTNRHVVGPGPAVAEAVFQDNEEVEVRAIYRDPVHDFGFFRFDPDDVRFMPVTALELAPEAARVGLGIRVIGSDSGEKLSILPGTLSRLDRPAPAYGRGRYNDFNTFYIQSASGTSGGSSGSPVIDATGRVVALNAGSRRRGASSYFLPLDRVVRALRLIQEGRPVTRGTLQVVFRHVPYDEARRLGLDPDTEARFREAFPGGTGLLRVAQVLEGGPADGHLRVGDLLVEADGAPVAAFVPLEEILDERVGGTVRLGLLRGGERLDVEVAVADLHALQPATFLEVGGAVLHPLSYQQARTYGVPARGVVVASAGHAFRDVGSATVLTAIAGRPVPDLDAAEAALAAIPDGRRVPVRFFRLDDPHHQQVVPVETARRWFPMRRCTRDDATGAWPCREVAAAPPAPPPAPAEARPLVGEGRQARTLAPSLVQVRSELPFRTEGVYSDAFRGTGLVADLERGWVLVDRDTVPVALADVTVTVGGEVELPARVRWLHPFHDLAVIEVDPDLLAHAGARAARLSPAPLGPGDRTWLVGLSFDQRVVSRRTRVDHLEPLSLPLPQPPFFRPIHVETVELEDVTPTMGGVLADRRGRVRALWASYAELDRDEPQAWFHGMPADIAVEVLEALRAGRGEAWPDLGFEMGLVDLGRARDLGLSEADARALVDHDPARRQVLAVLRRTAGTPADALLQDGDLIVEADGAPVTRFRELERLAWRERIALRVVRDGREVRVELPVARADTRGPSRVVRWAGALIHEPHAALARQRGLSREGVYVAWTWYGSPAARYHLRPTRRIVAVDGTPTPDLDAFLEAVRHLGDRSAVRVRCLRLDGQEDVVTLKLDEAFWPLSLYRRDAEGRWARVPVGEAPGEGAR